MSAYCPMCGCEIATVLGTLGRLDWVRCRNCGIEYSTDQPEDGTTQEEGCE